MHMQTTAVRHHAEHDPEVKTVVEREPVSSPRERRFAAPSSTTIARFLGASLGGALIGGILVPPLLLGAVLGAACGAGVVVLRTQHAH